MEEEVEGGVLANPASNFSKEMAKWEMFPSPHTGVRGPGRPYVFREFPLMLLKALPFGDDGKIQCMAATPHPYDIPDPEKYRFAEASVMRFNEACQTTVNNEEEMHRAFESGFRKTSGEAIKFANDREASIAQAAAERAYSDRGISDKAKREVARAEFEADGQHLEAIPEAPLVKTKAVKQCKGEYNKPCANEAPAEYLYCDDHGRMRPVGAPFSPQCIGTTKANKRCSRRAQVDKKVCGKHIVG